MTRFITLIKYFISGGSATAINIATLYVLTEYAHVYYLLSAVLAFVVAFFVSFFLQKFWTFKDNNRGNMGTQALQVLLVALANLGLNTLLLYALVEYLHLWYVASAIVASILLALTSFFIYRVIFNPKKSEPTFG